MLVDPELTVVDAEVAAVPPVTLRRRIPAVAAAEPRGAMTPGRVVVEEAVFCDWEEPLAMVLGEQCDFFLCVCVRIFLSLISAREREKEVGEKSEMWRVK